MCYFNIIFFFLSSFVLTESGRLEFDEFVTLAAKFIVEEDAEAMQKELREAFRLYDKEGKLGFGLKNVSIINYNYFIYLPLIFVEKSQNDLRLGNAVYF